MRTRTAVIFGAVVVAASMATGARDNRSPNLASLGVFGNLSNPFAPQQSTGTIVFTNVNVVPMDADRVLKSQTVIVQGDRIRDMGPTSNISVPSGATRIDGSGKYLMPGLAEMHGHMPGGDLEETVMFLYVANGVTTVRGMLGRDFHLELRRKAQAGEIIAPTLYMAGPSFNGNSVSSPEQAAEMVRRQKEQGWDLLKIHPGLTAPEYDAMASTAAEVGIRFGGHVPADVGLRHAIEMGQETFDHLDGFIEYLNAFDRPVDEAELDQLVALVKGAGAWVVPTMVLWDIGIIGRGDTRTLETYSEMRYWPADGVRGWARRRAERARAASRDPERADLWADNRMRVLEALADGGARVLMGTDSPQIFSVPGFSLHREMAAMAEAGMTPYQILVSGTQAVGDYFGRQDSFGTVAIGRRADLILLNSNPLREIGNVQDRAGVMVRGRWLSEGMIQSRLAEIAQQFATDR
ncbi:MAG: amidohydrolase family protein [Gemmatimonadota bacterium]|nr:MAG: amidohydrolase family protein [Gemmatimonadota bacterium]